MFPSNAKRKFGNTCYVKNKRLALLLLFFRLSLKKYVQLKRTFYVQKFGVKMHQLKELRRVCGCVNFLHGLVHDYITQLSDIKVVLIVRLFRHLYRERI